MNELWDHNTHSMPVAVPPCFTPRSLFVRPLQGISFPPLREGAITPEQYAATVRRQVRRLAAHCCVALQDSAAITVTIPLPPPHTQVAAVMQGYMQGQLARTKGEAAARDVVVGLFDSYQKVLEEGPEEDGLTMMYFLLQRTEAAVVE